MVSLCGSLWVMGSITIPCFQHQECWELRDFTGEFPLLYANTLLTALYMCRLYRCPRLHSHYVLSLSSPLGLARIWGVSVGGIGQLLCRSGPHTIRIGCTMMHGPIVRLLPLVVRILVSLMMPLGLIRPRRGVLSYITRWWAISSITCKMPSMRYWWSARESNRCSYWFLQVRRCVSRELPVSGCVRHPPSLPRSSRGDLRRNRWLWSSRHVQDTSRHEGLSGWTVHNGLYSCRDINSKWWD